MSSFSTCDSGYSNLGPKTAGMKRRYRVNKKTPTTTLTADPANFRALVQQFTGCNKTSSISSCRATSKGPININFALGIVKQNSDYPDKRPELDSDQPTRRAEQEHHHPQHNHQMLRQQEGQEEFWDLSFLDNISDVINGGDLGLPTCCIQESSNAVGPDHISQGIVMDDLFFLA